MQRFVALALCLLLHGSLGADRAAASPGELKSATSARLKAMKDFAKQRLGVRSSQIAAVEAQVRAGLTTPASGLESVAGIAGGCLSDAIAQAVQARIAVTDAADTLLAAGDTVTTVGFLTGDGSLLDQFMGKLNAELEKFRKQVEKRVRGYAGAVTKSTSGAFRHTVALPSLRMDAAPVPNDPSTASVFENIIYPSRVFVILAGSSSTASNDGKACLAGRAFLTIGTQDVNVALFGPGSPAPRVNVDVTPGTGYWQTCFTGLTVGNFRISVDQDPNHDTVFQEVSTEYAAIGVP